MSDTFDPDAWPHTPSGAGSAPRQDDQYARPADDDDDDYDTLDLSSTSAPAYEEDDDDYDSSTFAGKDSGTQVDDYPISDYDEDYDYGSGSSAPAAGAAPSTSDSDYDDDDSGYGNYDSYDDDDDNYNDYDDDFSDDSSGGGNKKKLLIALGVIVALLVIIIGGLSMTGGKKDNSASKSSNSSAPASTAASAPAGTPATPTDDVTNALNQSLVAWGKFAVDGNLDDVRQYFVNSGPQFERFQAEAPGIVASPPGGAALSMTMKPSKTNQVDDNNWIVSGVVTVARDGNTPQTFNWEIRLQRANAQQPWQILSVRQV